MLQEKIRIGIIGANAHYGWSMRAHLPALLALPEYEISLGLKEGKRKGDKKPIATARVRFIYVFSALFLPFVLPQPFLDVSSISP